MAYFHQSCNINLTKKTRQKNTVSFFELFKLLEIFQYF